MWKINKLYRYNRKQPKGEIVMYQKIFSSQVREQLINSVNEFCYRYTDGYFMEKCLQITKRLALLGSKLLSISPTGELAAGIIYTAGEGEENNGIYGYRVAGEEGLKFICSYYNKPEYSVYGDYKNIKRLLRIDASHPNGMPDYRSPSSVIKIFGIGSVGIDEVRKSAGKSKDTVFVCISDDANDLDIPEECEKVLLSENNQGIIIPECTERIERIAETSDALFVLLEPGSIDVLEGQALGAFVKPVLLKIITILEKNNPSSLTAKLMINGMDASLRLPCTDGKENALYNTVSTIYSFPVFENEFSSGDDFFSVKTLLKSSGAIKTVTARSSGSERLINSVKECTSGIETSTLKGIIVNIAGPIDMGLCEIQGAVAYLKSLLGSLPVLYRSRSDEDTGSEAEITIIFVYK